MDSRSLNGLNPHHQPYRPAMPPSGAILGMPVGDTVLRVGEGQVEYRVSSAILSHSSPVFEALYGPHFLEGQADRSNAQPRHVDLPEDDPVGLEFLLSILHKPSPRRKYPSIYWPYTPENMLALVVAADKYLCVDTIRPTLTANIMSFTHREKPMYPKLLNNGLEEPLLDTWRLASAAYMLILPGAFAMFTRRLLLEHSETFLNLPVIPGEGVVPSSILSGLMFNLDYGGLAYIVLKALRSMAEREYRQAVGLCLMCITDESTHKGEQRCDHRELLKKAVESDPLEPFDRLHEAINQWERQNADVATQELINCRLSQDHSELAPDRAVSKEEECMVFGDWINEYEA
ncbi:hypothetical protein LTR56_004814 [Elasticomyces elasticus]|nr:hypothetical protein LTR56_004814 [Elasticomyces elasticus]KAK3664588.1 hypothetical protein LTR22_004456 [Elasticomyces elasticus]KAK5760298.1 hypothetical protein LTS12_009512 [Elasticomyces elasticus]